MDIKNALVVNVAYEGDYTPVNQNQSDYLSMAFRHFLSVFPNKAGHSEAYARKGSISI